MEHPRKWKPLKPPSRWWLRRREYLPYTLREFSVVFMLLYALMFTISLFQLRLGESNYMSYQQLLTTPPFILLNIVILAFTIYHAVTWFRLTPTALPPLRFERGKMPGWVLIALQLYAWILVSYVVYVWIFVG